MDYSMTTTTEQLAGYRVVKSMGIVRGVTVRSRGIGGQIAASIRTVTGGRIEEYIELAEDARKEAFHQMVRHAELMGANAVVGVRFDATEMGETMTEVMAYGTAVVVEPA